MFSQVFMVSSLNHHICILKLTVHCTYVDTLLTGQAARCNDPGWQRPRLQRTQWFDVFDMQQRVEAFRCLWGVMAYLTRNGIKPAAAAVDAKMGGT
jgi:hypothetical protein